MDCMLNTHKTVARLLSMLLAFFLIAAALVGTFFGILACYGLFGPMGAKLENYVAEEHFYFNAIKEAVAAAIRGSTPLIAVEYGRRAIPYPFRPSFAEMEERLKSG